MKPYKSQFFISIDGHCVFRGPSYGVLSRNIANRISVAYALRFPLIPEKLGGGVRLAS